MSIGSRQGRGFAFASLGGIAAALLILWIPVGVVEMVVASSGISEAWPAAAPPLGLKARLLLAMFAALMVVGIMSVTRRARPVDDGDDGKNGRDQRAEGARQMGFAFSKLTALARGRMGASFDQPIEGRAPSLRRADAHPDAPARAPIFASRDFSGLDIFARPGLAARASAQPDDKVASIAAETPEPEAPAAVIQAAVAPVDVPQPTVLRPAASVDEVEVLLQPAAFHRVVETPVPDVETSAVATPVSTPVADPTHGLTIAQLTERLERGLSQRSRAPTAPLSSASVFADMPVAAAVPVRDSVATDADDALRAALGALRTMAGRAR